MHIYALGSIKSLCNKTGLGWWPNNKPSCIECLIREDAMYARGWKKTPYHIWYNSKSGRLTYSTYLRYKGRPRESIYIFIELWAKDTLKVAVKMSKLGAVDMGGKGPP